MGEILLIAADWQFRALVRAQLLELGYAVRALPSLEVGLSYLLRGGRQPRLTVLDTQGMEIEVQMLENLRRLTGGAPLILCGGAFSRLLLEQIEPPPDRTLLRPFRVGDLVEQVRRTLA
jgi:DNA-binding response OmpR family regulator